MSELDVNQLFQASFQEMESGLDGMELAGRRAHHKILRASTLPELIAVRLGAQQEPLARLAAEVQSMSRPLQNESVKRENPIIWQEEKEALYLLFREAVEREQSSVPWAALYLLLFFPDLVRMHVQRRLNPDVILRPPSAFVYCMQ
jgi:hypothetical protein